MRFINKNLIEMSELETQIWNTIHNWCDAQSNEIPDQNRRYLMDEMKALVLSHVSKSLAPHRCPVCNGNGSVPNGFYAQTSGHWSTTSTAPETCRSCGGTGIVWG